MYVDVTAGKFADIQKGEYVKLTISDTGGGIVPEILPRIFDPFFSTKKPNQKRGSGLGLSVVHAVVEDHKGCIDYESIQGVGTSFYIYLPTTREKIPAAGQDEIVGGNENILIVDDDRVQREVNGRLLERLGYTVHAIGSGEEALEFISQNSQDMMIIDMIMPDGIDGTETLKQALKTNPSQKAILMSGYAESTRVKEALKLGASSFIRKPLTLEVLGRAVREALDSKPNAKS
jgi:CheY-like chemotaxis protein